MSHPSAAVYLHFSFLLCRHRRPRHLHSFPTRRSSDLQSLEADEFRRILRGDLQPPRIVRRKQADDARRLEIARSEEHTSELQSLRHLVCRLLLEKKKKKKTKNENHIQRTYEVYDS